MNTTSAVSRRAFLQTVTLSTVAFSLPATLSAAAPSAKLRAAIIGHTGRGDYGHGLDAIFQNRPGIEVVAVADPDEPGRAKVAQRLSVSRTYADYKEMLEKEKPQLVSIAMRQSDQHYPIALAALKIGAHLYMEKPFTTTPAEADELLSEGRKNGLKIAVAHTLRMVPNIQKLKANLDGIIGDLREMRAYGKQDVRAGGEDMMVLGSHLLDLLRMFSGDPLWCTARVLAKGHDITRADARLVKDNVGLVAGDEIFAHFAFPKGVNASFTSVQKLRGITGQWGIELYGSTGAARINCDVSPTVFIRKSTSWSAEGKSDTWTPLAANDAGSSAAINTLGPVGDWLEAIEKNREPMCSGKNGAWAVEMAMGIYHAALSGTRAEFPLKTRTHPLA